MNVVSKSAASAMLIVLWAITLLSGVILGMAVYFNSTLDEQTGLAAGFRARQLAESGLAIGLHPQVKKGDPVLHQEWGSQQSFHVTLASEGGRININTLLRSQDRDFLLDIFAQWGLRLDDSQALIDALMDWVDTDDLRRLNGAERPEYEAAGYRGVPRNKPFESPEEMAMVRGMDQLTELKPDWRNFFTVWSSGKIDVNEASPEMLQLVLGITSLQAESVAEQRLGPDGIKDTVDDVPYKNLAQVRSVLGISEKEFEAKAARLSTKDSIVRVESTGKVGRYQKTVVAVVRRGEGGAGQSSLLAWLEPRQPTEPAPETNNR